MGKKMIIFVLFLAQLGSDVHSADTTLEILLTNDDGYESVGLSTLRDALIDEGHRVTVVAPLKQQSGSGMKVSLGTIELVEHGDDIWSVDGSPVDAVLVGINHVMKRSPDLVVSGANFGQNLGANVVISGTVGGAAAATLDGIPAIALSVGLDLAERDASPHGFPSTLAAFPRAAHFTALLIKKLNDERRAGKPLVPLGLMLNINYPGGSASSVKGVRIAPVGRFGGFRLRYDMTSARTTKLQSIVDIDTRGFLEKQTDTAFFGDGFVTISVLEPNWNSSLNAVSSVPDWLMSLAAPGTYPADN